MENRRDARHEDFAKKETIGTFFFLYRQDALELFDLYHAGVCPYFLKSFSFIMQRIHYSRLSAVSNSCVSVIPSVNCFSVSPRVSLRA